MWLYSKASIKCLILTENPAIYYSVYAECVALLIVDSVIMDMVGAISYNGEI